MVELTGIFNHLQTQKIVVAGDLILDTNTFGKVNRISPEAPVPVVNIKHTIENLGGSGNVIMNLCSLGAQVTALGRVGNDYYGKVLLNLLQKEEVDTRGIITQENYQTPMKNRIIASNQQLLRIDHEEISDLTENYEQYIINWIPELLKDAKALAISDYGKGFLTPCLLKELIYQANLRNIPIIADPKGIDFTKYEGVTILKPNLSEAYAASGKDSKTSLSEIAANLLKKSQANILMITQSENGITNFLKDGSEEHFPVSVKEVKDVTGAGDTVLAIIAYSIANHISLSEATKLANIAAAMAIEKIGCARISLKDLSQRLLELNCHHKIFTEKNIFLLKSILKNKKFKVFLLNGSMSSDIFEAIFQFTDLHHELLICIKEEHLNESLLKILISIKEVTYILHSAKALELIEDMQPIEIKTFKECYLEKNML